MTTLQFTGNSNAHLSSKITVKGEVNNATEIY